MQAKITEKSFTGQNFYLGIDCHKGSWTVTILNEEREHKTMNTEPNPGMIANYMKRNFPGGIYHAVYEAGFSGFKAYRELNALGVKCIVTHPADIPMSLKEKLQKTDKVDSRKLARSLRSKELTAIDVPSVDLEADRALVRQRFTVMKELSRTKNRIKSFLFEFGIDIPERFTLAQQRHWSKSFMEWLKGLTFDQQSLKQVLENYIRIGEIQRAELLGSNRQVRALSQSETYRDNYRLLVSVPGIGLMTAMTILVELGDIRRFERLDDLCNYIGLVPSMHSSGEKTQTGKMMHRGRKEIKIMLIEAAWVAVSQDPAMMAKYTELKKKMHKNKAIIRIARKLISRIRYVLIHQQEYEKGVLV